MADEETLTQLIAAFSARTEAELAVLIAALIDGGALHRQSILEHFEKAKVEAAKHTYGEVIIGGYNSMIELIEQSAVPKIVN